MMVLVLWALFACMLLMLNSNTIRSGKAIAVSITESSALDRARALNRPDPQLSAGGEFEDQHWWQQHGALLQQARREWGPLHAKLYDVNSYKDDLIDEKLRNAVEAKDPDALRELCQETNVANVYRVRLFTPHFIQLLLEELQHQKSSGIPIRRPNGMNRYGLVLNDDKNFGIGIGLGAVLTHWVDVYLKPLASLAFPDFVGPDDLEEQYSFVVHYQPGQDVELKEHTDASTVTANICLQPLEQQEQSWPLYFKEYRYASMVSLVNDEKMPREPITVQHNEPGEALLHLGGLVHGVTPVDGERSNLVVWMYGKYDYVRIAPYSEEEVTKNQRKIYARYGWNMRTEF